MINFFKDLIPSRFKQDPSGLYNRLRGFLGVAKRRYYILENEINKNPDISRLFPEGKMRKHYVHEIMRQTREFPALFVNQIRYYRIYEYFLKNYPDLFDEETKLIDVGDTSGILFQAMQKDGLSVNINPDVVEAIRKSGIKAEVGDAEKLRYPDKSFDYAFCFQCLEHLKNPLRALDELARITKRRVFISIPYVNRTNICSVDQTASIKKMPVEKGGYGRELVNDSDCHVFEFSTSDMKNLLSFTRLNYIDNFPINYTTPLGRNRNNEGSFFNFFILEPKE